MKNNATRSDWYRQRHPDPPKPVSVKDFQEMFDGMFRQVIREADEMAWTKKLSTPPYAKGSRILRSLSRMD